MHNSPTSTARPRELDERTRGRLDEQFARFASGRTVRQAIVAVETIDGSARWVGAADAEAPGSARLGVDSPHFIASITKLYTAAVVLRLFERGQLGLDASIADYLPGSLIDGLHRLNGTDYTARITIRHLLSHTSGLADYFEDRPKGGHSLSERLASEGDRAWSLADVVEWVRSDLAPHFPPQPPMAKRQKVRYSDTNYQLLGSIIETVTGRPLHAAFEDEVFRTLGLQQTYVYPHNVREAADEPVPIQLNGQPWPLPLALRSVGPNGGIVSTLRETVAFLRALVTGRLYEQPETLSLMQGRWNRFAFPLNAVAMRLPSWPIEYGLGMMRFRIPAVLNGFRRMPVVFGHTGSIGSWLFWCPEHGVVLAGTVNQLAAGALPYRFVPGLLRALAPR